jgi:hypothetical protein
MNTVHLGQVSIADKGIAAKHSLAQHTPTQIPYRLTRLATQEQDGRRSQSNRQSSPSPLFTFDRATVDVFQPIASQPCTPIQEAGFRS